MLSPPPVERQIYLSRLVQLVEQRERRERNLPMPPPQIRLPHRIVVWERHEGHPGRRNLPLHRERHCRDTFTLDSPAYQPYGPVT